MFHKSAAHTETNQTNLRKVQAQIADFFQKQPEEAFPVLDIEITVDMVSLVSAHGTVDVWATLHTSDGTGVQCFP
jgi:hypothetical protein